ALAVAVKSLGILATEPDFRRFVLARGLLLSIALVPPFFVLLAQAHTGGKAAGLGLMIVASGLAASLSSPVWGRMSDRSSRQTMALAALAGGALCLVAAAMVWLDFSI